MNIDASYGLNRAAAAVADSVPLVSPDGWRQSSLHALDRDWPETNCDLDLWIELAAARGFEPEALLGFAHGSGVLGVHVQAERAAIDLRRADLDQFQQFRLQAGVLVHTQAEEGAHDALLHGGRCVR